MHRSFLIDLDAIMDTRIGALIACGDREDTGLGQKYLNKVLSEPARYFGRVIDDFEWIEEGLTEKWKQVYDARDIDVLKRSISTEVVELVRGQVVETMLACIDHPIWSGVSITLNVFPYNLDEQTKRVFSDVIGAAIYGEGDDALDDSRVAVVSIDPKDLTVEDIGNRWHVVYMYDFQSWSSYRAEDLEQDQMKALSSEVFAPTLFRILPDKTKLKTPAGKPLNPFHETERLFALWVTLRFLNPDVFSIPDPRKLNT